MPAEVLTRSAARRRAKRAVPCKRCGGSMLAEPALRRVCIHCRQDYRNDPPVPPGVRDYMRVFDAKRGTGNDPARSQALERLASLIAAPWHTGEEPSRAGSSAGGPGVEKLKRADDMEL